MQGLVSHNGTLGLQVRRIQQFEYAAQPASLLILHSDGLSARWDLDDYPDFAAAIRRSSRRCCIATTVAFATTPRSWWWTMSEAADVARLRADLGAREADIASLRTELEETNRGVVALYAELDDKAAQLHEALDLKSRFLSYMSHEFRTPLAAVTSMTGILIQRLDGPLTPEQAKQVDFIRTAVRELTEMVDDLLDLAKVDAGRITISAEWFEMVDLFAALRGMFKPILATSDITLIVRRDRTRCRGSTPTTGSWRRSCATSSRTH